MLSGGAGDDELVIRFTQRRCGSPIGNISIDIPPGTWEIVCTSKDATEDECAIISGLSLHDVVHGYSRTFFHDLLTSKGCDVNKSYSILKKTT